MAREGVVNTDLYRATGAKPSPLADRTPVIAKWIYVVFLVFFSLLVLPPPNFSPLSLPSSIYFYSLPRV